MALYVAVKGVFFCCYCLFHTFEVLHACVLVSCSNPSHDWSNPIPYIQTDPNWSNQILLPLPLLLLLRAALSPQINCYVMRIEIKQGSVFIKGTHTIQFIYCNMNLSNNNIKNECFYWKILLGQTWFELYSTATFCCCNSVQLLYIHAAGIIGFPLSKLSFSLLIVN